MNILLQPSSGKEAMDHFEDTISSGVDMDLLKNYLSNEEVAKLSKLNLSEIKVWGFVPIKGGKIRSEWLGLKENDWVLFYANKGFYYIAKVHSKVHNKDLAEKLWGRDVNGKTWEYIYFIKEGKGVEVPYNPSLLLKKDGTPYKKNHIVQGAILLDSHNSRNMKNFIENFEGEIIDEPSINFSQKQEHEFLTHITIPNTTQEADMEIKRISKQLKFKPVRERISISKVLVRNPKFARLIKEKAGYVCKICGIKPFIQKNGLPYAEAHHIYELSKNRIDVPEYMICVCPTCHKVIHYGNKNSLKDREDLSNS